MKINEKIKKLVLIIFLAISFLQSALTIQAYAFGGIGIKTEFDSLQGDGKYLGSDYRGNYKLDIEELRITDVPEKAFNFIANAIFNIISFLGFAAAAFFFIAMDFDLAKLLQPQINKIQETLHNGLFTPMLQLAIVGAIVLAICKYARRDFVGLLEQMGKVCFIMVLSVLVVSDSAKFLSFSTSVTKSAAVSILTGINDIDVGENLNSYAANAASVLWISLVHEPWKALEFGDYNCTDEDVEFFLTASGSKRKDRIAEMMDGDKGPFSKNRSANRVGQGIIILLTVFVKFIVYIAVTALYFVFQAIAIFFILMAPLILLLSLTPGYDFELLGVWTRKIMETQIGVLIITFVIGVMVFFDRALQSLSTKIGWFIVLLMQISICVCLFLFRWQIFTAFNNVQRGVQSPNLLKRQLIRAGNPYSAIEKQYMFRQVRNALGYKKNKKSEEKEEKNKGGNYKTESTTTQKVRRPNSGGRIQTQEKNAVHPENGSYYASRDVTDNWREIWADAKSKQRSSVRSAQRPITSANSKVVRRRHVLADRILPEQDSGRRREPIKLERGYSRSANDKMEPITVAFEDITDKQSASGSGNVTMLPETKRPITNAQHVLPGRSSKSNVLEMGRNTMSKGPKVSGSSFTHEPIRIPREKINPVMINRIKKQLRSGVPEATRSQIMSHPTTEQFRKEAAVSKESIRYQVGMSHSDENPALVQLEANRSIKPLSRPTTNHKMVESKNTVPTKSNMVSDSRTINKPEPNAINSETSRITDTRPKTNQKTVEGKNPASTRNSNRASDSRPINWPVQKVSNAITYNSAASKISDTTMKELKGSKIQVKRPEMIREGKQEKRVNFTSVHVTELQREKQEKKIQPVIQSYPGNMARLESSKSSQLRKTIRIAPKVQNATVNGFKAYKGSAEQGNE